MQTRVGATSTCRPNTAEPLGYGAAMLSGDNRRVFPARVWRHWDLIAKACYRQRQSRYGTVSKGWTVSALPFFRLRPLSPPSALQELAPVHLRRQRVDQARAIRTAPASDQVKALLARIRSICPTGDVVETGGVARPQSNRVDGWVQETRSWQAIGHCLLVDQRQIASPPRRGKAGSAPTSLARAAI